MARAYIFGMSEAIRDNAERSRYELEIDGQIVFANYRRDAQTVYIRHVEAPIPLRGSGAAGRLMQGIVEIARRDGFKLVPFCSYAVAWLRRHAEARDVLATR
jgi:predicted GNAT family acetyltransferase